MGSPRVVLVTGANIGIGFETVKVFLQSSNPYRIFLGSRSESKGNEALAKLQQDVPDSKNSAEVLTVDLANDESIDKAYNELRNKCDHIDILINNAGKYWYNKLDTKAIRR